MTSTLTNLLGPTTGAVTTALDGRASIVAATQGAENAVLTPRETGAWSHDLRHALAARIAAQHDEPDAAEHYRSKINDSTLANLADPQNDGSDQGLAHVCAFMDRVAQQTRDVNAQDIKDLQSAGVSDADIVRLCELNAFLAYQLRVLAGLRLLGGKA
ncbi:hypothetical protein [Oceaniglobus ichthyenteri]|uniref:hypothetical protein n=1 Tax=Oceaniglobus ichthyenteri TaxID=2136177 RepID=UPI000D3B62CC|nr:hypothetical protein [Oceaniglobus ichthyenteri]